MLSNRLNQHSHKLSLSSLESVMCDELGLPLVSVRGCGRLGDVPQCVVRGTVVGWEMHPSVSYVGLW